FPRISGIAAAGNSVEVALDGAVAGTVSADGSGSWSFIPADRLAEGPHTATAQARDPLLDVISPMSETATFVVDTVAPPPPALVAPSNGALVKTATPRLSGTAEPGSTVAVTLDGERAGTAQATSSGDWSFTPAAALAEGLHTVTLQAT